MDHILNEHHIRQGNSSLLYTLLTPKMLSCTRPGELRYIIRRYTIDKQLIFRDTYRESTVARALDQGHMIFWLLMLTLYWLQRSHRVLYELQLPINQMCTSIPKALI